MNSFTAGICANAARGSVAAAARAALPVRNERRRIVVRWWNGMKMSSREGMAVNGARIVPGADGVFNCPPIEAMPHRRAP
ncbi:hypothetical protein CRBSH125_36180 [Afipia carboxidovorans]|nr:hypothetical protein CRBSH125_36180 [Afipia carboxidovorans]